MLNNNTRIAVLIGRRLDGTISEAEVAELNAFMAVSEENKLFVEQYSDDEYVHKELEAVYQYDVHDGWMRLVEKANIPFRATQPVVRFRWLFPAVAAILVLAVLTWIFIIPKNTPDTSVSSGKAAGTNDVAPGGDRATLQLSDGRMILLDSAGNGSLVMQGGAEVVKTDNGSLKYTNASNKNEVVFNTLRTPKGGQFKVQLPDGSTVYLNASSSIRYPTAFVGSERRVDITGEAYFSIAKNAKQPFKAYFNNEQGMVEVTGTEFNLSAYNDDDVVRTTLIEGKVKMFSSTAANAESVNLKPGEQVVLSQLSHLSQPIPVQTDEVTAWKDGYFHFDNKTITEILKTAARWYDIDVKYEYQPKEEFRVRVPRAVPISKLLGYLEATGGVHFSIEGKTITVKK